ncbi:T9SS type A sorting domain-containing protein [Marivirga arenosa]|uniref:T9SS type A sorting domain-containing protein n=1 Tax=Marivirga arenosa TaxID=3059076 RepID=A0AA51ZY08_9BACT|nr:T9SS type A sorting domain-containing protein [Marivirga sp. BKB1-2]WNB18812.1 T9SS type A sorting domain-containing protein [Marivirga sp. BKB1-2]
MKKFLFSILFFVGLTSISFSQSVGDFQTRQSGNWNDSDTWEEWTGSSWDNTANTPTSADGVISILNSHIITISASVTTDQTYIKSGGQITINSGNVFTAAAGPGDDLTIESGGILQNNGTLTIQRIVSPPPPRLGLIRVLGTLIQNSGASISNAATSSLLFGANSIYRHNQDAGTIPTSTWNISSTVEITGVVNVKPSGLGQSFGNFRWDCSSQGAFVDLEGALTTVNGDFTMLDNAFWGVYLSSVTDYTMNVGGDFRVSGGTAYLGFNSANIGNLVIGGDLIFENGAFIDHSFDGDINFDISGNVLYNNASVNIGYGGSSTVTYNINGDLTISSSTISNQSASNGLINFIGSGNQNISGVIDFGNFDFIIGSNSNVIIPDGSYLSGAVSLTTNTGGKLTVGSVAANGAIQTGTTSGNIRVSGTRTFNSGSTIEYNGTATQALGNGFPSSGVNLIVNNTGGGVNMNSDVTIASGRTLTLTEGTLNIGDGNLLTLNGNVVTTNGGISGGALSDLTIGGTGAFGTLGFVGTQELRNFTINRTSSGTIILGGDLTVLGDLTQTDGDLLLNGNQLTINSNYSQAGGSLISNSASSLIVNGAGTLPTSLSFSGDINTITLNRALATLNTGASGFTLSNLNLYSGTLDGTAISIADGGFVERRASGSLTNALIPTGTYSLLYNNSSLMTSGPELHPTAINDLTKTGTSTLTVASDFDVNGVLTLSNGAFDAGANIISLNGDFVSNAASTLTSATVTFDGTTNLSGGTAPTFGNITVNGVFNPTSNLNVNGDITNNGTLNSSGGLLTLNGTSILGGANPITINDLTIGASGDVTANAAADLQINGNFTNNGLFDGNSGTVVFGGTTTISGSVPNFASIRVDGTLNAPASLNINGDFTVNGTFNDNDGIINLTDGNIAGGSAFNIHTLNANGAINNNNTGGVNIEDGITIGASTTFDLDGGGSGVMTLLSTPSKDAFIGEVPSGSSISGNINIQRAIYTVGGDGRGYHIVGFPATGVTVADIQEEISITGPFTGSSACPTAGCTYSIYAYNEAAAGAGVFDDGYTGFPASGNGESFTNGEGYYIFNYAGEPSSGIIEGNGAVFSGNFSTTLSRGASADAGWHMVSNPYPAATDWSQWDASNIAGGTAYLYNPGSGNYIALDGLTQQLIGQGQGFFVRAISNGVSLSTTEASKVTGTTPTYYRTLPQERFEIILKTPDYDDITIVSFNQNATDNYEPKYDAVRLLNTYETISTLTEDNEMVKVNRLAPVTNSSNCSRSIKLNLEQMVVGDDYALDFTGISTVSTQELILKDNFLATESIITDNLVYNFQVADEVASKGSDRFEIILNSNQPSQISTVSDDVCPQQNATIVLQNTESFVNYLISKGDEVVASVEGNGADANVDISTELLASSINDFTIQAFVSGCDTTNVGNAQVQVYDELILNQEVSGSSICSYDNQASFSIKTQLGANYYILDGQDTLQSVNGTGGIYDGFISVKDLNSGLNEFTIAAEKDACQSGTLQSTLEIKYQDLVIDENIAFESNDICIDNSASIDFTGQSGVTYSVFQNGSLITNIEGDGTNQSIIIDKTELSSGSNEFTMKASYGSCSEFEFSDKVIINVEEEIVPDLDITNANSCGSGVASVIINNAQNGKTYTFVSGEEAIVSKQASQDGELIIEVPVTSLTTGLNQFDILIEGQNCTSLNANQVASVNYVESAIIDQVDDYSICLNETLTIDLSANVDMDNYQLFLGDELLAETNEARISISPEETTTYTLTGSTTNSCEVNSINFTVEVTNISKPGILAFNNVLESSIEGDSYQWYLNGESLEDETNKLIVVSEKGDYEVVVTQVNCSATSDVYTFDQEILKANELLENSINLYPNPVSEKIFIDLNTINSVNITIFTLEGKFIDSFKLEKSQTELDMTKYSNGTYLMQFESDKGSITKRIIKQ